MNFLNYLFLCLLIFFSGDVFASEKGNGGDVVICRNGYRMHPVMLLDFFEMSPGRQPLFDHRLSNHDYVNQIADKLEAYDPIMYAPVRREGLRLAQAFENYLRNGEASPGVLFKRNISNTNDEGRYFLWESMCHVEQIITWNRRNEGIVYLVNKNLIGKLSTVDLRGLILHEALYISLKKHANLRFTNRLRRFNAELSRRQISELTPELIGSLMAQYIRRR